MHLWRLAEAGFGFLLREAESSAARTDPVERRNDGESEMRFFGHTDRWNGGWCNVPREQE